MIANSLNLPMSFSLCISHTLENHSVRKTRGTDQEIFTHESIWGEKKKKKTVESDYWQHCVSLWGLVWNNIKDVSFEGRINLITLTSLIMFIRPFYQGFLYMNHLIKQETFIDTVYMSLF